MTPDQFTAWLDGFLEGKDSLTTDQIATLRAKAGSMTPLKGINWGVGTPRMAPQQAQIGGYVEVQTSNRARAAK